MSVFEAMAKIEKYLTHCPSNKTRIEAKKDFALAIKEIIEIGYTWGRNHQVPFDYSNLDLNDLNRLLKFVQK
tara:strand:+ start:1055 stop:1270 length:216 start_codon:yes stop_codon:yes gene_type:complete